MQKFVSKIGESVRPDVMLTVSRLEVWSRLTMWGALTRPPSLFRTCSLRINEQWCHDMLQSWRSSQDLERLVIDHDAAFLTHVKARVELA
jgi:hypothetical protein